MNLRKLFLGIQCEFKITLTPIVIGLALWSKTHLIIHDSASFSITIQPKTQRHRFFLCFFLKGKGKDNK